MKIEKNKKIIIFIIILMVLLLLFIFGYLYFKNKDNKYKYKYTDYKKYSATVDSLGSIDYKLIGIAKNEEEYNKFVKKYKVENVSKGNFNKNNYIFVAYRDSNCGVDNICYEGFSNNTLYFEQRGNGVCAPLYLMYVIPVDKSITSTSNLKIKENYISNPSDDDPTIDLKKPILYLYPESDINVKISFDKEENLLTTYPKYNNGWNYLVKSDGTIIDNNGRNYYALYWDEKNTHKEEFKTGFYVRSEDSIKFLEEKLFEIGLTERESNEFIMYWLPKMEENGDNLVHFDLTEDREKYNKINIEPKPDSLLRISINIKKVNKKTSIKVQKLSSFERYGFTVVEWGGTIY